MPPSLIKGGMTHPTGYLRFIAENTPFLAAGALLSFLSSFGQTFFISIFGGEIRAEFGLSNGDWGMIYMIGTGVSAAVMVFAGSLADIFRVRTLGIAVVATLAAACLAMAFNTSTLGLVFVIFALRLMGQGMSTHMSAVAMSRWFLATRGRALAVAGLGFMFAEATLPLIMVWLKSFIAWRDLCGVLPACMRFALQIVAAGTHTTKFRAGERVNRHARPPLDPQPGTVTPVVLAYGPKRGFLFCLRYCVLVSPSPLCRNQRLVASGIGRGLSAWDDHAGKFHNLLWLGD